MFVHRTFLVWCLVSGGSACTRPPSPVNQVAAPTRVVAAESATVDAGVALTEAKVLAFVAYQEAVLALTPAEAGFVDAGAALVVDRARRDEQARAASGLSERELGALEELISILAEKRWLNRWAGSEDVTSKIQAWAEEASDAHKKLVADTLSAVAAKTQAKEDLSVERAQFGDDNVTLVLKYEARLYEAWQAQMKR